jgi:hypothetical protein
LCKENKLACIGPTKEEIAIALIGARQTKRSREALLRLLAYNLDGSVGEGYNCYVLNSGRLMKLELLSARSEKLANSCEERVNNTVTELNRTFPGFESAGICSTPVQIKARIRQFSGAIDRGERCSGEDF